MLSEIRDLNTVDFAVTEMLTRLIYHSENHLGPFDGKMMDDLNSIMEVAVRKNEAANITGALIFDNIWFMQVLEGEREALSATLRRIMADERHDNVTIMDVRPIHERMFANWWMGIAAVQGASEKLLTRHGVGPRFNPSKMTGEQALLLTVDLAQQGLSRKLASAAV